MLRILGLYHPQRAIVTDTFVEGRDEWVARDGLYSFWIVGVLAVPGAIVLRRRRTVPLYPLLAPIGVVIVTVLVTYASTRFRSTAEPVLVVLAAIAIDAAVRSVRSVGREEVVAVAGGDGHDRALRVDAGRVGEQRRVVDAQVLEAPDPPEAVGAGARRGPRRCARSR